MRTIVLMIVSAAIAAGQATYDFSQAGKTVPWRVMALEPGGCDINEVYLNSTTGMLRLCTAANTWADAINASTVTSASTPVFCVDAGSTDAYACSLSPAITAYVTGTIYRFKAATANTGAATIQLNGISGPKTIKKAAGGITTTLNDNDIRAGQWVEVVWDGTNMQCLNCNGNRTNAPLQSSDVPNNAADTSGKATTAGNADTVTNGVYTSDTYFPKCAKYTVAYTNNAFKANALTADVTIATLPARGKVTGLTIKHSVPFAGTLITAVTASVGDGNSTYNQYSTAFDVFQAAGDAVFQDTPQFKSTTMASSNISAHFISTVTPFGGGSSTVLTAGSVDVDVCTVVLP